MKLSSIIQPINYQQIIGSTDIEISSIEFDSRKVKNGSIFFAINGSESNGHNFIQNAIENGALAVVCETLPEKTPKNITWLLTDNSRKALSISAYKFYDNPEKGMNIIAVTGTNGKTTITFILKSIFETAGYKCGIIGTTGNYIGQKFYPATHTTPDPIKIAEVFLEMRNEEVEFVFMEVSSHALTQFRTESINFKAGIFTNLTHEHLDYHNTLEEYALAKQLLFNSLECNSFAIINADSDFADKMVEHTKAKVLKVGRGEVDFKISKERLYYDHNHFLLNEISISTPLIGRFNIDNIAQCFVTALAFGVSKEVILKSIEKAYGAPGRMQRIKIKSGASAIIDYAHSPDALEKSLITCREILHHSCGRLICLFGCGGDRDKSKRPIMGRIATDIADYTVITNDNPRTENPNTIIEEILSGISENKKEIYEIESDRAKAIERACQLTNNGDILLIAGKGHEDYQIIGTEKLHFSDIEEVSKFCI